MILFALYDREVFLAITLNFLGHCVVNLNAITNLNATTTINAILAIQDCNFSIFFKSILFPENRFFPFYKYLYFVSNLAQQRCGLWRLSYLPYIIVEEEEELSTFPLSTFSFGMLLVWSRWKEEEERQFQGQWHE